MSYVSVQHLQKNYAGTTVFSDIDCEINKGEFVTRHYLINTQSRFDTTGARDWFCVLGCKLRNEFAWRNSNTTHEADLFEHAASDLCRNEGTRADCPQRTRDIEKCLIQ